MKGIYALLGLFVFIVIAGVILLLTPAPAKDTIPSLSDLIVVDAPTENATLSSPISVTGKARGYWYFEASFPIELKNQSGAVIAQGVAQAQGDWMTEDFVPFSASVIFPPQLAGSSGTLVLKKDNPSGEPSNDQSISIPVTF
jgi:hypothetical protein